MILNCNANGPNKNQLPRCNSCAPCTQNISGFLVWMHGGGQEMQSSTLFIEQFLVMKIYIFGISYFHFIIICGIQDVVRFDNKYLQKLSVSSPPGLQMWTATNYHVNDFVFTFLSLNSSLVDRIFLSHSSFKRIL